MSEAEIASGLPGSRLITDREEAPRLTTVRFTDARMALVRGVADYIDSLKRALGVKNVLETWADPNEQASYPSVFVEAVGEGSYDAKSFTPHPGRALATDENGVGIHLIDLAELVQPLRVTIWATDYEQRMKIVSQLEDAFSPLTFMYGFKLELPHYFGRFAVYEPLSVNYVDDEDSALRRVRKATMSLTGRVAMTRVEKIAQVRDIRSTVTVDS